LAKSKDWTARNKKRLALAGKPQIVLAEFNRQQINEKKKQMYS